MTTPTLDSSGLTIGTTGTIVVDLRDTLDAALIERGLAAADYDATHEAALTYAAAALAYDIEQGIQIVGDMLDPRTCPDSPVLDGYAAQVGLSRRAATASTYVVKATVAAGTYTLPAGTVLQGGGTDGLATWTVDADTAVASSETDVDVTCQQTGPVELSTGTLRVITPPSTTVTVTYDSGDGDPYTVGRDREVGALLRVRRERSLVAVPSSTRTGIRAALLALDWVRAATVTRQAAGVWQIYLYPEAATAAQEQEVVDAVGLRLGCATTYAVAADGSGTYTEADGSSTTISWYYGGDQAVAVVVTLTLETGWAVADVSDAVDAAIDAAFAALDVGDPIRYAAVYCAIYAVEGVRGLVLTLNGGTADVTPATSTDYLIPSPITIS